MYTLYSAIHNSYERFVRNYSEFPASNRLLVIFISLLFAGICIAGVRYIEVSTDYRAFFSSDNPDLIAYERLQSIFSKNDNILFVIQDKSGDVFNSDTLSAIEKLTESAWKIPFTTRVDSITNFQYSSAQGDELHVRELVSNPSRLTAEEIKNIREIALIEPRLVNRIVSKDSRTTAVNVTLEIPGKTRQEIPMAVDVARTLAGDISKQYSNLDMHLTGNVMLNRALSESSIGDLKTLVPLMYLIIIATLLFLLRSITAVIAVVIIISLSIMSAMGLAGWAGIVITPPSSSAPTIIMTLAVADCIHIITTLLATIRAGSPKTQAIAYSLRTNFGPVFLTSLTTAIGFLSMNFADAPPLRDLGNIAAMGIGVAFLFSVSLLPALLGILPIKNKGRFNVGSGLLTGLADLVIRRKNPLIVSVSICTLAFVLFLPQLDLNDQYVNYFDESTSFRQDTDFTMKHLTGIYRIEYPLPSGKSNGISDPDYLLGVERFVKWLQTQPEVVHVSSIVDTLKHLNMNMHGDDPKFYAIPANSNLASQYLLLYEMSLPYGLDLNNQISMDKDTSRITVMVQNISTKQILALEERAQNWLNNNFPQQMITDGTGSSIIFAHMSERSINSMILGTLVAIAIIALVIGIALRSFKLGLLSIVTNMLPALTAMGIWAITVGELGFALSVMITMTLGIVVDDTIHFLSKYLRARREKSLNPDQAVNYAFSSVGYAIVTTTVVLVAGFMVLAQSSFLPNSGMALLTAITIGVALIIDLLLLPPLLIQLESIRRRNTLATQPI